VHPIRGVFAQRHQRIARLGNFGFAGREPRLDVRERRFEPQVLRAHLPRSANIATSLGTTAARTHPMDQPENGERRAGERDRHRNAQRFGRRRDPAHPLGPDDERDPCDRRDQTKDRNDQTAGFARLSGFVLIVDDGIGPCIGFDMRGPSVVNNVWLARNGAVRPKAHNPISPCHVWMFTIVGHKCERGANAVLSGSSLMLCDGLSPRCNRSVTVRRAGQ